METRKKILLIDDDIDIIAVVETILENEGYNVVTACNKADGIRKAAQEKPDLAIVDVMMTTQFEGFELAETFITDPRFIGMPVLMQTSIEVFESNDDDVMGYARFYRQKMAGKDMNVLLVQDYESKNAGVDYKDTEGKIHWLPVSGFIKKPVNARTLLENIKRVLN